MGHLDIFAKETFALETPVVTHGAVLWQLPPEVGLTDVRLDGLLRVINPAMLATLAAPWTTAQWTTELILEIKMVGDHLDLLALDRALLRRLARQIQRREDPDDRFAGDSLLWFVAARVPRIIHERRALVRIAPGCYQVGSPWLQTIWIAANELPLEDELVPFLIARSGRPLDAFVRWVKNRRPIEWLARVLESLPMSATAYEDLRRYTIPKTDDPLILARRRDLAEWVLEASPGLREEIQIETRQKVELETRQKVQIEDARAALRRVLKARRLALTAKDEARIDACADHDTLGRWLERAVVATSAAKALR